MERKISESRHRFLAEESGRWVADGLITDAQRAGILERYGIVRGLPTVVLTLGVVMIGIGILSFIAANWQAIPPLARIVLIVGGYVGAVGAACACEARGRRLGANLLLFLSGFLLLGGVALMSQIFHIQGTLNGLLGAWLLAYLPTLLIVRGMPIYLLYGCVAAGYINAFYVEGVDRIYANNWGRSRDVIFDPTTLFSPWQPTLVLALLVVVAWWFWRSETRAETRDGLSGLKRLVVGGPARAVFWSNFLILNWFTWICVLNSSGRTALPYVFGVILLGSAILLVARRVDSGELDWQGLLFVAVAGFSLTFPDVWRVRGHFPASLPAAIIASAVLGGYLVSRIMRRYRGGGFATFLFCALLMRWYFSMFHSFMSKSLFFLTGGAILLLVAWGYRRWSKAVEGGLSLPEEGRQEGE
jgi:Predicted membrane protein